MFLSVIVPIFNTNANYIVECLKSIESCLSNVNYEVIIVNDGSTNIETIRKIEELRGEYFIIDQENKGLPAARNVGIKHAKGEYILPLDSDDLLHEDIKAILQEIRLNAECDIFYSKMKVFGTCSYDINPPQSINKIALCYANQLGVSSIFKKSVWEKNNGYDESYKTIEDWDFWIRCSINGFKFKKIEKYSIYYRQILNGESLAQKTIQLVDVYHKKTLSKVALDNFSKKDLGEYFLMLLRMKKRRVIYLVIYLFLPKTFNKFFKNKKFWE